MGKYLNLFTLTICIVVLLVLTGLYNLRLEELSLPIKDIYAPGDGRLTLGIFKIIVNGSFNDLIVPLSGNLNAPFNFEIQDFPLPFFSNFLYIKLLSLFSSDAIFVFNIYYISTYFFSALAMFWVLRKLRINPYIAVAVSLIFTFLPYHFWRLPHTFYSGYFFIPIWVYYLLILSNKKPLFFKFDSISKKYIFDWSKRNKILIGVLIFSSTWNFYYTFFFSFLICFVLISHLIHKKGRHHILSALLFLGLAVSPFAANMLPYKIYQLENGSNSQVGNRNPISAETLGLTITSLVFPNIDHKVKKLDKLSKSYSHQSLLFNESNDAILGFFGALGFTLLIFVVFFGNKFSKTLNQLSKFN